MHKHAENHPAVRKDGGVVCVWRRKPPGGGFTHAGHSLRARFCSSTYSRNEAFINQIAGFKDDFAKMHTLMLNYADYLRKSAKAYRETQQNVITQARSLQN